MTAWSVGEFLNVLSDSSHELGMNRASAAPIRNAFIGSPLVVLLLSEVAVKVTRIFWRMEHHHNNVSATTISVFLL